MKSHYDPLKPCPWCGEPGRVITPVGMDSDMYQVVCANALCPMFLVKTFAEKNCEDVIRTWNKRFKNESSV